MRSEAKKKIELLSLKVYPFNFFFQIKFMYFRVKSMFVWNSVLS